jgi:hypothetical protein
MLQTLKGVKKVPLFPKAGQGFNSQVVKSHSTVTIAYDDEFRIIMYCSKKDKKKRTKKTKSIKLYYEDLLAAMSSLVSGNLRRPPCTDTDARRLSSNGIPAVTGRKQAKGGRSKKRNRAGGDGGGGDE